jgi:glutamate-1-semialdehyde 2,1-aminomutase
VAGLKQQAHPSRCLGSITSFVITRGVPLCVLKEGSVMGLYFSNAKPRPGSELPNREIVENFHLACLNNGVQMGPGSMVSMATAITQQALEEAIAGMSTALAQIAP